MNDKDKLEKIERKLDIIIQKLKESERQNKRIETRLCRLAEGANIDIIGHMADSNHN